MYTHINHLGYHLRLQLIACKALRLVATSPLAMQVLR